jgi:hypothetical protein
LSTTGPQRSPDPMKHTEEAYTRLGIQNYANSRCRVRDRRTRCVDIKLALYAGVEAESSNLHPDSRMKDEDNQQLRSVGGHCKLIVLRMIKGRVRKGLDLPSTQTLHRVCILHGRPHCRQLHQSYAGSAQTLNRVRYIKIATRDCLDPGYNARLW